MRRGTDKYTKLEQIGQGASGEIYKIMRNDTKEILVAKIIKIQNDQSDLNAIEQEIKIMTACSH
jgi:serine/threonine protein kinase